MNWNRRYAMELDTEQLIGHLIGRHDFDRVSMAMMLKDFGGEYGDRRTPIAEMHRQLVQYHREHHPNCTII